MSIDQPGETSKTYSIAVNGRVEVLHKPRLAVVEIRALFGLDPTLELVVEGVGSDPDSVLEPSETLELSTDRVVQVFSRPHTMFG